MRLSSIAFLVVFVSPGALVAQPISAAALLAEASKLQNTGKFTEATTKWQQFLRDHADDPSAGVAYQGLGTCLLQTGQWAAAVDALQQALKRLPEGESGATLRWNLAIGLHRRAEQTRKAADQRQALTAFQNLIAENSLTKDRQTLARFYLAHTEKALGNKTAARKLFAELLTASNDSVLQPTHLALASLAEADQDWPAAIRHYREYLKKETTGPAADEARFALADALLASAQHVEAEKLFGELAARDRLPTADYAHFRWSELAELRGDVKIAAERWAAFLNEHPKSAYRAQALRHGGQMHMHLAQFELAIAAFSTWLKENPADKTRSLVLLDLARCESKQGQHAVAVKHYGDLFATQLPLDNADAIGHDAVVAALASDNTRQASVWTDDLAEKHAKSLWTQQALLHLARQLAAKGEFEPALERCKNVIKSEVTAAQPPALYLAGFAAMKLRKFDVAIPYFETLRDRHTESPHTPAAVFSLGVAWESLNANSKAQAAYQHLIDHFAQHPLAEQARKRVQALP